jgi:hypothetical protein
VPTPSEPIGPPAKDAAIFVLQPLIEHQVKIDADLVRNLGYFVELDYFNNLER